MKQFDQGSKALTVSLLLMVSGVASPCVLGIPIPGQSFRGVTFQAQETPGQASAGYFYQSLLSGVNLNQMFGLVTSGETTVQPQATLGGGGVPGGSPVGPGDDVYYAREGGGYVFMTSQPTSEVALPAQPLLAQIMEVWNDPSKKRSRFRIYVEILELLRERPLSPFEVAFRLRLNVKRTRRYLEFLVERGVVERVEEGSKLKFSVNPEGIALLEGARRALMLDRYC
jgi:predicted transcriptional regulator